MYIARTHHACIACCPTSAFQLIYIARIHHSCIACCPTSALQLIYIARIHASTIYYIGTWHRTRDGTHDAVVLEGNVDTLSIVWKMDEAVTRELDWSWGCHTQIFTLAGGDPKRILRWRPSVRHFQFDDDHIVWVAYDTKNKRVLDRDNIVYTRSRRNLKHFIDIDPHDWCLI